VFDKLAWQDMLGTATFYYRTGAFSPLVLNLKAAKNDASLRTSAMAALAPTMNSFPRRAFLAPALVTPDGA
jgi:hypothetical protein